MITSSFGKNIKTEIFGGSHEAYIGTVITGLPAGTIIDTCKLEAFMKRRAPGQSPYATARKETDSPILKGGGNVSGNTIITDGTPLIFHIQNTDTRSDDYSKLRSIPRPGHADFAARMKYGQNSPNMAGGGPFSARMTAPLCIAGGIALQFLESQEITVGAHIYSIKDVADTPFDPVKITGTELVAVKNKPFPTMDEEAAVRMTQRIKNASTEGDSLGGIIETAVTGLSPGIGGPMYDGLESILAPILFGIPAVKGVEFGAGFKASELKGSQNNDPFTVSDGEIKTATNNHGGILGGITSGMPLLFRVAFKPTPSIEKPQPSVNMDTLEQTEISVTGRHDPCVAVRAVPICEAAAAVGLLDAILSREKGYTK